MMVASAHHSFIATIVALALALTASTANSSNAKDDLRQLSACCEGMAPILVLPRTDTTAFPALVRGFRWKSGWTNPEEAAVEFLATFPNLAGLKDPFAELQIEAVTPLGAGASAVKFQQVIGGLPVLGRKVIVAVDSGGTVSFLTSNAAPVDEAAEALTPKVSIAAAIETAMRTVSGVPSREPSAWLAYYIEHAAAEAVLVWVVSIGTWSPPGSWLVLVNAETGALVNKIDRMMKARGRVYEQNPATGIPIETDILRLVGDGSRLTGQYGSAYRYMGRGTERAQTAIADPDGNFLYEPSSSQPVFDDQFSEVNAYYHTDRIADYFVTTHSYRAPQTPIAIEVNYFGALDAAGNPIPFDNALYDGERLVMQFGQGTTADFAYDAAIIYHEYTHSVVDTVANLQVFGADVFGLILMPAAIHEGTSDFFAAHLTNDPNLNEYILIFRHLENNATCPEDMLGEPHQDGLIIGGAFWQIRESVGPEVAERLIYGALNLILPDASLRSYAEAVLSMADQMVSDGELTAAQRNDIEAILKDRGMTICDRVIALDDGLPYSTNLVGLSMLQACDYIDWALQFGWSLPSAFQWSVEVPETATALTINFDLHLASPGESHHWLHLRSGSPVEFELVNILGLMLPLKVRVADATFPYASQIVLTPSTDPPLQPGTTYHIAVSYLSCPPARYTISAAVSLESGPEPVPEMEEVVPEMPAEEILEPEPEETEEEAEAETEHGEVREGCGCKMAI